jgi:hypothetical protein
VAVAVPEVGLDPVEGQAGQREADHLRPGPADLDAGSSGHRDAAARDQGGHALQRDASPDEPEAYPGDGDVGEAEGEGSPGPEDQVAEHLAAPLLIRPGVAAHRVGKELVTRKRAVVDDPAARLHVPPEVRVADPAADDDERRDQGGADDQSPEGGPAQPGGGGGRDGVRRDGHGVGR